MKLIPLSQGMFAQVDDEDFDWLMQRKWYAHKGKHTHYAGSNIPAIESVSGKRKTIKMHREIMKRHNKDFDESLFVDHANGIGTDNRKCNIRTATREENGRNRKAWGSSKYLGVCIIPPSKERRTINYSYQASIFVNKKNIAKRFKTEIDAAMHYNKLAIQFHGEFAKLNVIE